MICNLPINHVGAIGDIAGRVMTGGGTLHFQERFSPADMLATIESERLNTIAGVPHHAPDVRGPPRLRHPRPHLGRPGRVGRRSDAG